MRDYYKILGRVRESRWEQALTFENSDDAAESRVDESMLSAYRVDFYLPSTPCGAF